MAATVPFPEGTKMTTMNSNGRKKCHYTFPNESEMVEEYDAQTDKLLVRKRRDKTFLGGDGEWVFEVGEPPARVTIENDTLRPSSSNPVLVRGDRPHAFEWRVRNLPYPKPTYSVTIDQDKRQIVVRTSNKKYFKRIDIDDLDRARLPIEDSALSWEHQNSTLIITYKKPPAILQLEKEAKVARLAAPDAGSSKPGGPDGDVDCKQQ